MEDIYSIWREEIDLHLKLCRLNVGGEATLPPFLCRLTGKHVSEIIRDQIITSQVRNTEYYDGHHVPLPTTLLKTTKKRKYISEDPDITYCTAQKGLTLLVVVLLDEGGILSINELHEYITSAFLTSPEDIKKLSKLTSKLPKSMEIFTEQLKVFTNLLYAPFTASCPLFLNINKIICSLMYYEPKAGALIKRQQRAAIEWIISPFKRSIYSAGNPINWLNLW